MRKMSKLIVLAAISSALFSGAALAGGSPATLGGSSSFAFFDNTTQSDGPDEVIFQGGVVNSTAKIAPPLTAADFVAVVGPSPSTQAEVNNYISAITANRSLAVIQTGARLVIQSIRPN